MSSEGNFENEDIGPEGLSILRAVATGFFDFGKSLLLVSCVWAPCELLRCVRKDQSPVFNVTAMIFAGIGTLYATREFFGLYNNALLVGRQEEDDDEDDEDEK
jgi:hypothetical protein